MAERARDRLGRPLPADCDPAGAAPEVPVAPRTGAGALQLARDYLNTGLPFHAHEVFEQQWRATTGAERDTWRALAQFAAGVTQLLRGNEIGGNRLLIRAAIGLRDAGADQTWQALELADLIAWCTASTRDLAAVPWFGSVVQTGPR